MKARCPVCGTEHSGVSLPALQKIVKACCARVKPSKRTKSKLVPPKFPQPTIFPDIPFTLKFDRSVISQNRTTYSHWTSYKADKTDWLTRLRYKLSRYQGLCLDYSEWVLERVYTHPAKEMDYANFVGGAKPLIDGLIYFGIILDDSPTHFHCTYEQVKGSENATYLTLLERNYGDNPSGDV